MLVVQQRRNTRVYVVEDSAILARLLRELIETAGMTVVGQADNASQAIADIAKLRPDVVTIDIALRKGTGFDVLESLAKNYDKPPLRIVLSNFTSDKYQHAAQKLGAEYFLDKAKQTGELLNALTARRDRPSA